MEMGYHLSPLTRLKEAFQRHLNHWFLTQVWEFTSFSTFLRVGAIQEGSGLTCNCIIISNLTHNEMWKSNCQFYKISNKNNSAIANEFNKKLPSKYKINTFLLAIFKQILSHIQIWVKWNLKIICQNHWE